MELLKSIVFASLLTASGYLLGRKTKEAEILKEKEHETDKEHDAIKKATVLTDDDCDNLMRMFNNFKR